MNSVTKLLAVLSLTVGVQSFAKTITFKTDPLLDPYWDFKEVTVTELKAPVQNDFVAQQKTLGEVIMVTEQLVALGESLYALIANGRPSIDTQ